MTCAFIIIGIIFGAAVAWFLVAYKYNYRKIMLTLQKLESNYKDNEVVGYKIMNSIGSLEERVRLLMAKAAGK